MLLFGGIPLVFDLLIRLLHREFGSDLLAGISIVASVLLGVFDDDRHLNTWQERWSS